MPEEDVQVREVQAKRTQSAVPPDELFEKLQPFKELVAEDIREGDDDTS
ncbi:MAG: hypothetical protein HOQ03_13140 [Thermoleophilia bacterium]|nr:hypothetical protein [Thermoleophilia bacterium]